MTMSTILSEPLAVDVESQNVISDENMMENQIQLLPQISPQVQNNNNQVNLDLQDKYQIDDHVPSQQQQQSEDDTPSSSPDFEIPSSINIAFGMFSNLLSTLLYIVDVASVIYVAHVFATNFYWAYCIFTMIFLVLPAVIVAVSAGWFQELQVIPKAPTFGRVLSLILLAPVVQFMTVLIMGWKIMQSSRGNMAELKLNYYQLVLEKTRFAGLKLISAVSFQPALQLYILFHHLNDDEWTRPYDGIYIQSIVIGISMLNIAETLTRFHCSCRMILFVFKGEKQVVRLSWAGTMVVFLIHLCANSAGIFPTILLMAVKYWIIFVVIAYGVLRTVCFKLTGLEKVLPAKGSFVLGFVMPGKNNEQIAAGFKQLCFAHIIWLVDYSAFLITWFFIWNQECSESLNFRIAVIASCYFLFFMAFLSVALYNKYYYISYNFNEIRNQFKISTKQPNPPLA